MEIFCAALEEVLLVSCISWMRGYLSRRSCVSSPWYSSQFPSFPWWERVMVSRGSWQALTFSWD